MTPTTGPRDRLSVGRKREQVDVIVPADPQLITSASAAVPLGGAVHDTAFLSGGVKPTGTINFRLYNPGDRTCTGSPAFTSTVAVDGNGAYTSASFTPATAGAYGWVASYSGDARNHRARTACSDPAETVVVGPDEHHPSGPGVLDHGVARRPVSERRYTTRRICAVPSIRGARSPLNSSAPTTRPAPRPPPSPPPYPSPATATTAPRRSSSHNLARIAGSPATQATMNTPTGPTACGDPAETVVRLFRPPCEHRSGPERSRPGETQARARAEGEAQARARARAEAQAQAQAQAEAQATITGEAKAGATANASLHRASDKIRWPRPPARVAP